MKWILIILLAGDPGYSQHIQGFTYDECMNAGVKVKEANPKAVAICTPHGNVIEVNPKGTLQRVSM